MRCALALLVPLILFAIGELAVETFDLAPSRPPPLEIWNPVEDKRLGNTDSGFVFQPNWLWEPRAGATFFGDVINDDGYRGPAAPVQKTPGRLRIATLGDSSTFGFGVLERDAWPRQLEAILRARGRDVEVLNFGCIGFTLAQGVALYHGRVARYEPDVVICAFGAVNDQFATKSGYSDAEKILLLTKPWERLNTFFTRYATYRWVQSWRTRRAPDPLHETSDTKARVPIPEFTALFSYLKAALGKSTILVIVSPPRRLDGERDAPATIAYTNSLKTAAASLQLPLCDVRAVLRAADRAQFGDESVNFLQFATSALFLDQWHPTAQGHALYAETVAATLGAQSLGQK